MLQLCKVALVLNITGRGGYGMVMVGLRISMGCCGVELVQSCTGDRDWRAIVQGGDGTGQ